MKTPIPLFAAFLLGFALVGCDAANSSDKAATARIIVDADNVIREQFPEYLFGFNVNHYAFEADFVAGREAIPQQVIDDLQPFSGAMYRYPGGLVANRFWWEASVDATAGDAGRAPQKKVRHESASPVQFGVEEYFDFVAAAGGKPWYVLNLVGWDAAEMINEMPAEDIAASNARLAELRVRHAVDDAPRYYQLGNELDRAEYQWSTDKYVARAQLTMAAVREVDPEARFVVFLRDFDWAYKDAARRGTKSLFKDFIPDALAGLPDVEDMSLHFYYDDPDNTRKIKSIERRLQQFERAIAVAKEARGGKTPNVWITEHARGVDLPRGRAMDRADRTGNLSGAISTADFLIGIAQMPAIQGAFLHGLNAGPWQVFDATIRDRDLRPRPVYWGMRMLRDLRYEQMLATTTEQGEVVGDYLGGYDIRAAGLSNTDRSELGVWAINRALVPKPVDIEFASLAGKTVSVQHNFLALPEGGELEARFLDPVLELDAQPQCYQASTAGVISLSLPAASVSGIRIAPAAADDCDSPR